MKKPYESPKIIAIGDMVNNTLGASGTAADNGTYKEAAANGNNSNSNNGNGNGNSNKGLKSDSFSNDSFI